MGRRKKNIKKLRKRLKKNGFFGAAAHLGDLDNLFLEGKDDKGSFRGELGHVLKCAFVWKSTRQGREYWESIDNALKWEKEQ